MGDLRIDAFSAPKDLAESSHSHQTQGEVLAGFLTSDSADRNNSRRQQFFLSLWAGTEYWEGRKNQPVECEESSI